MTRLTLLVVGSLVLGALVACCPERLRRWVDQRLSRFPSLHSRVLQFIDRLLSELDGRYPALSS